MQLAYQEKAIPPMLQPLPPNIPPRITLAELLAMTTEPCTCAHYTRNCETTTDQKEDNDE